MKKDAVTLERIKLLHPKLREEADAIYNEICEALTGKAMCRFSYTLRTFKEQDDLYAKGRTAPGSIVTKAKAGLSMHNYGLAIDIVLIVDKDGDGKFESASWDVKSDFDGDGKSDWQEVVTIFKQYGWTWGGDWKFYDAPHFEKPMGHSIRQLIDLYNKKKVDENNYVLI
jgi:peptidoglycan L-alanyl-D-glutamate endopeptidase CwlK